MLLSRLLYGAAFLWAVEATTTTFTNSRRFLFDVDGGAIDAYGSKINCEITDIFFKVEMLIMQTSVRSIRDEARRQAFVYLLNST